MSLLAPLYALGLLAVAAPIVFHLIRRTPRGEVPFSSLMFLAPSPPRLTRRSRLDQWLLLLLRASVLCLLAFAFARPFLRQPSRTEFNASERRRVAVLVDASASMRRGNLWTRAKEKAVQIIASGRPGDELALLTFDRSSKPLLGFAESSALEPGRRLAVARAKLDVQAPTWGSTNLGQALIDAVAALEDVADASERAGRMPRRIVLIGDLQQGSRLDALGGFEWPSDVELDLESVADDRSNASLQSLAGPEVERAAGAAPRRVRVTNDPTSRRENFELVWLDEKGRTTGKPTPVYVPPGESRVVRVPRQASNSALSLHLRGDEQPFDNTVYFADERPEESTVLYLGKDSADDPNGLLYYLQRVFSSPGRTITVRSHRPSETLKLASDRSLPLIVVAGETTPESASKLRQFLRDGGTVLDLLTTSGRAETLGALAGVSPLAVNEARVDRDVMLGEIAFDHPMFAPFAGPQFNDFTKIRFWKYRHFDPRELGQARVVARFENGDAAIVDKPVGKGRLLILASGWSPADSQWARSSKFVPMISALLDSGSARPLISGQYAVGDPVAIPHEESAARGAIIHRPGGAVLRLNPGQGTFTETDQPGVYHVETSSGQRSFAVNLDPVEGKTAPLAAETLEQLGCRLANPTRSAIDPEQLRQMHNAELEARQKIWRWLILAAIGLLIAETCLAGRLSRSRSARVEALTS